MTSKPQHIPCVLINWAILFVSLHETMTCWYCLYSFIDLENAQINSD